MTDFARTIPYLPCDQQGPIFSAPWEARAFAMAVKLSEAGLFKWTEWASLFSATLATSQEGQHAMQGHTDGYYECWLAALESMLAKKGIVNSEQIANSFYDTKHNWPDPDHTPRRKPVAVSPPIQRS